MKLLLVILIISICIMPCYAVGRRAFRVDFPYFDALYDDFFQEGNLNVYEANNTDRTQEISENIKTDNSAENNQVINATQPTGVVLNIDKAYFSKNIESDNKTNSISNSVAPFRISTSLFYPVVLSEKWKDSLESIIGAELVFSYAESKYGIFAFNPGLKFGYSYFNGKNGYEINYHKAYFSFPLDFSFYLTDTRKIVLSAGLFYSFDILKFQEKYKNPEIYRENHIGLDAEIKFSQNISSFLDLGFALGALYSFNNDSFPVARAGVSLDWRL